MNLGWRTAVPVLDFLPISVIDEHGCSFDVVKQGPRIRCWLVHDFQAPDWTELSDACSRVQI